MLQVVLLTAGLLASALFLVGIAQRGLSLFDLPMAKLWVSVVLLAIGAGALAFVAFCPGKALLRALAGAGLLLGLGTVLVMGLLWARDMRRTLREAELQPVEPGRIGILVAPANHASASIAEARAIEENLAYFLLKTALEPYITVHHVYPLHSAEQAMTLANRLGAHVVVWKTEVGRDPVESSYHVTVLGANETAVQLVPEELLRVMALQDDLLLVYTRGREESATVAVQSVAQVAAGFGSLAVGRPMVAAALFRTLLDGGTVPEAAQPVLQNHYASALMALGRADLAIEAYKAASVLQLNARSYVGVGNAALQLRDWDSAEKAYARAVAIDPYDPMGYCGLGVLRARQNSVREAASAFEQAIGLDPSQPVPYALRGYAYELEGRAEAAQGAYRESALRAGPNQSLLAAAQDRADQIVKHPPTAVPTATLVPIPTVTPIPTSQIYLVKSGDTLAAVADELGVSVDELVKINNLPNADTIAVGQQLRIPVKLD
jgi:tetratricopeptide (TPR) repeat protein